MEKFISGKITPQIKELTELCKKNKHIDPELYTKYNIKRSLRDINGMGVLAGLTETGDVIGRDENNNPSEGRLYYHGYNIEDLIQGFISDGRFGFEETVYLLLFGELPNEKQLADFNELLSENRTLPTEFVRDIIMKAPCRNMMNILSRSVLTLYAYDENPDDTSYENVMRQCIQLIAKLPLLSVYGYQAYKFVCDNSSMIVHAPVKGLSTAENILHMLRSDSQYTELEAKILDLALVLHAEHGGGDNSTFTTHVVTSAGTDTYSAAAASLCALKGYKSGGASTKVIHMFDDMKKHISNWSDDSEIEKYLTDILQGKAFDKTGIIYGIGHPVYSLSDPRANVFKGFVERLAMEKDRHDEFLLYSAVERLAPKVIAKERTIYKGVSINVDFYSGFVYSLLNLPPELYTPIFAVSRFTGWSAHRMEELINPAKIIRPAYKNVSPLKQYVPINKR